jgi:hypothetical protein
MPALVPLARLAVVVGFLASVLGACGEGGDGGAVSPPAGSGATSPPTTSAPGTVTCAATQRGYQLDFPEGWFTNQADVGEPCRFFHPEPFTLAPQTDATGIAVNVRLNPVAFEEVTPAPGGSSGIDVLGHRRTTIDGHPSVRVELRSTGQGLLPEGTSAVSWFVDAGEGTLVATTSEAATAGEYQDNVRVLDAMMGTLRLSDPPPSCSAGRSTPVPTRQAELPEAVSMMRSSIMEAAGACDYGRLAELATAGGSQFTYSFGGEGRPASFWREAEAAGRAPLRMLVELLDGPAATRDAGGTTQYLWPAAFVYERWQDVPPSAREDLRRIYGDDDLQRFAQFGSYLGHRVGITEGGDWIFYVGGD